MAAALSVVEKYCFYFFINCILLIKIGKVLNTLLQSQFKAMIAKLMKDFVMLVRDFYYVITIYCNLMMLFSVYICMKF